MARARLQKTLADYLAIAAVPILIIVLVGSLVFFLQEMFFEGRATGSGSRIHWVLFWYVIGMVLISRIAIESGRAHAGMFSLALGGAVALFIFKFESQHPFLAIGCLALIWWCADKLTWDCSLIDESEDASGEGLLQVAGVADEAELPSGEAASAGAAPSSASSAGAASGSAPGLDQQPSDRVPLWKRLFVNESERAGKPHAPGLWVVYFSLAALPLFGFGQTMLSRDASRDLGFRLLVAYVAAALGLLLLTSFLGLRRYLRQRQLAMPTTMAATWVVMGTALAFGILVLCLLLPRPDGNYSVTAMIDELGDKVQDAADRAFLNDDGGQGDGQRSGPADQNADQGAASDPNQQGQPGGDQQGQQGAPQQDGEQGQQTAQSESGNGENSDGKSGKQSGEKNGEKRSEQNAGKSGDKSQQTAQNDSPRQNEAAQSRDENKSGGQKDSAEQSPPPGDREVAQNDSGQPSGKPDDEKKPAERGEKSDQQPDKQDQQNAAGQQDDKARQDEQERQDEAEKKADDAESDDGSPEESAPPPSPSSSSSWLANIGAFFKWAIYAALAAAGLYFLWKNWAAIGHWLQQLWHEFLSLFGRRPAPSRSASDSEETAPETPLRPFAEFRNPFASRAAAKVQPAELVRYTFEALQAWAFENGCPRSRDQTPIEFGQTLRAARQPVGPEASELGELYARVAYAGYRPGADCLPVLEKLWRKLT